MNESANRLTRPGRLPAALSRRRRVDPRYYAYEVLNDVKPAVLGRHADQPAADLLVGRPHRRGAAEPALSRAG